MVARVSGDKVQYVPQSSVQLKESDRDNLIPAGGVYFGQSPTERKRSGSYYTPEDVVDYIVSNTVCKGLEDLWEQFKPELQRLLSDAKSAISDDERERLQRFVDESVDKFVRKQVFAYRILDPAMGSGHFLVNALQRVTNFIIEKLNETPWPNDAFDTSPGAWRRRAVERCIFGVDINPLATELAKLSLWLASASEGKPLSFLNHHLKTGNSLIGARISDLRHLPSVKKGKDEPSLPLYIDETIGLVLSEYEGIAAQDSDAIDAVEDKKRRDKHIGAILTRVKDLANVWASAFYGNHILSDQYAELLELAGQNHHPDSWELIASRKPHIAKAREIAEEHRFFHWDLEFAEVFGNGGVRFDAIVANPPYVGTAPDGLISARYQTAACGDLYAWFLETAASLRAASGSVGVIVPLSVTFSGRTRTLRAYLLARNARLRLVNCDNIPDCIFNTGKESDNTNKANSQRVTIAVIRPSEKPVVETTSLLRWQRDERHLLFDRMSFATITRIASEKHIPKIGYQPLVDFYLKLASPARTIRDLCLTMLSESQTDDQAQYFLIMPRSIRYFVAAVPEHMSRSKVLTLTFRSDADRDLAMVLLNSNVHFWYWLVVGDGFLTNVDIAASFPVPDAPSAEYLSLAARLRSAMPECATYKMNCGKLVPNYNFNKRMDILLDIDQWIAGHVAPDLNLPRDIFAQYKSNSFLRPLDLSSLAEEPEDD